MKPCEVNLHTHTYRCKHAKGCVKEYCREAVKAGLKVLGFSEHCAFPDDRYGSSRMLYRELEEYRQEIEEAKSLFPELAILAGLEADIDNEYSIDFCAKELKERLALDYLAGSVHFVQDANGKVIYAGVNAHHSGEIVKLFAEKTVFLMQSGIFDFIPHPDMVAASIDEWTLEIEKSMRLIIEKACDTSVPLEINAYGLRKYLVTFPDGTVRAPYPYTPFWKLFAEYRIPAVAGSDAHEPENVYGNLPQVFALAEEWNITICNDKLAQKILAGKGK